MKMKGKIGVVNYNAGNIKSLESALEFFGQDYVTSSDPKILGSCDKLIIPGDGHAVSTMEVLNKTGLADFIREFFQTGKFLLGICIGCQIVMERSEEGPAQCLGLIPGTCQKLPGGEGLKVPQMGWNQCVPTGDHFLFRQIPQDTAFYFVHSYHTSPTHPQHVLGRTQYGISFATAVGKDNLSAVQFHPEKSGPWGLKLLKNFLEVR